MAEAGRLISSGYPFLEIQLAAGGVREAVRAYVDTGFEGYVAVPAAFARRLGAAHGSRPLCLADDSIIWVPSYRAVLQLGTFPPFDASLVALGNEYLLGRGIVDRFRVIFDHGRRVLVEQ